MKFLGIEIDNVRGNYTIELTKGTDKHPPRQLSLSARREGQYVLLDGNPIDQTGIASGTITGKVENGGGADGIVSGKKIVSLIKGNTEVPKCVCVGYMLLKFEYTPSVNQNYQKSQSNKKPVKTTTPSTSVSQPATDYVVTTAYNVVRKPNTSEYVVHSEVKKGKQEGQVHVEQICAYRLEAFLTYLKSTKKFDFTGFKVQGYVGFSGEMSSACPACVKVWEALEKTYTFLEPVNLRKD